jgi:hypothetical protein
MNSLSTDPELQTLLALLKPILRRVIEIHKSSEAADQRDYAAGYHNITVCEH